jgi:hypothetical protein
MKTIHHFALLLLLLNAGCNPNFYIPNTQNVPLITARKQTNLLLAGNGNQVEFQGAYGLTDQIAIQLNGGLIDPRDHSNGNGGSGKLLEAGVGYYKNIDDGFLFDVYALTGIGSMENHFPTTLAASPQTTGKISASLLRVGIQPSFGFVSRYFSMAASARIVNLFYSNVAGSLIFNNEDQVRYLSSSHSNLLFEPALTLKAGLEPVKFQLQLALSYNSSHPNFKQDNALLSLGLSLQLK